MTNNQSDLIDMPEIPPYWETQWEKVLPYYGKG